MIDIFRTVWGLVAGFLLAILVQQYEIFDIEAPIIKLAFSVMFFALLGTIWMSKRRAGVPSNG